MVNITTPQVIRDAYLGEVEADDDWLQGRIESAERLLANRLTSDGDLASWANTQRRVDAVQDVVAAMVLRLVRAGAAAVVSSTEVIGPTTYTTRSDPRAVSATLWVTAEEWASLGVARSGARTVRSRVGW